MNSSRGVVACAVFVIAIAVLQLSLNAAGTAGGDDSTRIQASLLASDRSHSERGKAHEDSEVRVTEDSPLWRCETMGNRKCAPAVFPAFGDPRPLRMVGLEVHQRKCPSGKGAKTRLRLLKRSAIYGHCPGSTAGKLDLPEEKPKGSKEDPKGPKEPSTARGKR